MFSGKFCKIHQSLTFYYSFRKLAKNFQKTRICCPKISPNLTFPEFFCNWAPWQPFKIYCNSTPSPWAKKLRGIYCFEIWKPYQAFAYQRQKTTNFDLLGQSKPQLKIHGFLLNALTLVKCVIAITMSQINSARLAVD